ncbi:MAG: hydroxymethylglutaryl-CoA synthase [Gammaproteobacteria bacterium]|nr:hydroxymethylglutaryl-CoA synthase [Gammaproteobacteria bacterium]
MHELGIESASFYTSRHFIDLATLAAGRNVAQDKYYIGLGQYQMAVPSPDEDIVTLAANASKQALQGIDIQEIGLLLFATESGIDQSKAAGMYIHRLLNLPKNCRVLELKQACYSATGAVMIALDWLKSNPEKKALILASDIARYGLGTVGEPSQGGGAVAMVLSAQPKLIAFETGSGIYTEEAMDFWRPNYRDEALVDGKYSCELYLKALKESWLDYHEKTGRDYQDHDYFLFHIPIPRLAEKALQKLALVNQLPRPIVSEMATSLEDSLRYSRTIGNCYTGSLYLGLLSLLEHRDDLAGKRLGFYSYGSGCIGEFFSAKVLPDYSKYLFTKTHRELLALREDLNLAEYEAAYQFSYPKDGSYLELPRIQRGPFRLAEIKNHQRVYESSCH